MLLSFHKFPSSRGRTPTEPPASPWLPPKFANPKIVAKTIENNQNSAESRQNRSIQWISHPLSGAEKARRARACGCGWLRFGSDLPETGFWRDEKSLIFQGLGGAKGRGSGLVAVRSYHNFSTLDARVLKLKVCSSKDVFLFTGRAYTHNCSEGNERKVNHAGCKSGSPE